MQLVRTTPVCSLTGSGLLESRRKYLSILLHTLPSAPRQGDPLPVLQQLLFQLLDEDTDSVPPHLAALAVEVEVLVPDFWQVKLYAVRIKMTDVL